MAPAILRHRLAALSQIALPWFLGRAIDSVAFKGDASQHDFHENIAILAIIAVLCGIFSALRGALFLLAEAKMAVSTSHHDES